MEKIPTVFRRDPAHQKRVLPKVTPGCEWVLAGEGVPTQQYNGVCVMYDGAMWWIRRVVKPGKRMPQTFRLLFTEPDTGTMVGWEPMERSTFKKWHAEALGDETAWPVGTYELCGPTINGNPERLDAHELLFHTTANRLRIPKLTYEGLRDFLTALRILHGVRGVVWHHPDGRMAKLKGRDFG